MFPKLKSVVVFLKIIVSSVLTRPFGNLMVALHKATIIAASASEPEANERGSSLISRRLHYRGLQSLFLIKRKELWLCANGRFRMRSGMRKELWLCTNRNILGCAVIWRKKLWLCANG